MNKVLKQAGRAVLVVSVLAACESATEPAPAAGTAGAQASLVGGECRGAVGAVTVENLTVPAGARCTLTGTIIQGNLFVQRGATLVAYTARVGGNIQAENARNVVVLRRSTVGGSIQVKQGGAARVERTTVNGDVQLESNRGRVIASYNTVRSNMQVFQNTGGVTLVSNRIAQNLQCKENVPAPTGGGNVAGNKEDQCAAL